MSTRRFQTLSGGFAPLMSKKDLIIVGAGGHAKVVFDVADSLAAYNVIYFISEIPSAEKQLLGIPILGGVQELKPCSFVVAIGDNLVRRRLFTEMLGRGFMPVTLQHSSASISKFSSIASGTVILPHAVINAGSEIGENCIINSAAVVEHDCKVASHSHISVGARLAGNVRVEEGVLLGVSSTVIPSRNIGEWSTVGAGAVVTRDVEAHSTVVGIPAKPLAGSPPSTKKLS